MYKSIIRPILFRMNPEKAHNLVLKGLRIMRRIPGAGAVMRMLYKKKPAPQLARRVFGIDFPHPVGLAAGLDKNATCYNELSWCGFSFIEVGSFTPEAQPGNPAPRLFRLPADQALINRMGLGNEGVDKAVERIGKDRPEVLLAGSIATDDRLISVMYHKAGIPLAECVAMMSTTPAKLIGIGDRKGSIAVGKDADLVLFDEDIAVSKVLRMGKTVWQKGA